MATVVRTRLFRVPWAGCEGWPGYRSVLSFTVTNQNLRTSIIVGRLDLGMPNYRFLNAGHALSDQDVSDLVAYLASLRPAESAMGNTK